MQPIFLIHRVCICEFTYSLKFIWNSQIGACSTSVVICRYMENGEILESPHRRVPRRGQTRSCFPFSLQLPCCEQVSFLRSLWHLVVRIFLLLVVILLFQVASKDSAEVLISVSELQVATCLARKTPDELHSALSYRLLALSSVLMNQWYVLNRCL